MLGTLPFGSIVASTSIIERVLRSNRFEEHLIMEYVDPSSQIGMFQVTYQFLFQSNIAMLTLNKKR